jgi:plasmid maintenance system antidote protein VapI
MAADDFNENDLVNLSDHGGTDPEIPTAITDKFAEVFNKAEGDDAEGAENTPAPEVSAEDKENARIRRNERNRQAKEELEAEEQAGDEVAEAPAEEVETEQEGDEVAAEAADEQAVEADVKLDPALRFVAQEFGWTDDKINKLVAADSELATETFSRLADLYTNSSRQLLNPGSPVAPGTQAQQNAAQSVDPLSKLDKLYANLAGFAEVNGQSLVDEFLTPLKQELIDPVRQMMAAMEVQRQDLNKTEARQTMGTLETKFGDFYGQTDKAQSPVQKGNRKLLGETADQIRHASRLQGKELSVSQALNRAHLLVTADHRERAVRSQIKEQVQKRSKSITAKPTQRQNPKLVAAKSGAKAADAISRFWADKGIDADLDD